MRLIDADVLTEDCKRYLGTLNPDKDGKECTRIHWLIGVLENAPTIEPEPCEDAISRQRLLNDLKELIVAWEKYPVMVEQIKGVETAIGYVKTIPSVTPKRKTGKWIREYSGVVCSECDYNLYDILSNIHTRKGAAYVFTPVFYNFCPNCGADMNPLPKPYKPKEKNNACD